LKRGTIVDYGVIAVVAIVSALLIQAYVVKPYRIPTPSMAATLRPGDRVLVNRVVYHLREPRRGDVVVFRYPKNREVTFIKRIVGLPGDTLAVRDGRLYVGGRALTEPYVHVTRGVTDPTNPGMGQSGTTVGEPWSLSEPYTVPPDAYFVMGDNRTNSDDSRDWGTVPRSDIVGEGSLVYWPLGRWGTP
jgi:signal peptidase I